MHDFPGEIAAFQQKLCLQKRFIIEVEHCGTASGANEGGLRSVCGGSGVCLKGRVLFCATRGDSVGFFRMLSSTGMV